MSIFLWIFSFLFVMYVLRNIMQFNGLVLDKQNTLENNNMNSILQFAFEIVCCLLFVFFLVLFYFLLSLLPIFGYVF